MVERERERDLSAAEEKWRASRRNVWTISKVDKFTFYLVDFCENRATAFTRYDTAMRSQVSGESTDFPRFAIRRP